MLQRICFRRWLFQLVALGGLWTALLPNLSHAVIYTVTNLNDSGSGSLRQAIATANATFNVDDTIEFAADVTGTIKLTSGSLVVNDDLVINGPGTEVLTISGNDKFRVFLVNTVTVTMSGLTLEHGSILGVEKNNGGGAIFNRGTLTLKHMLLQNNTAGFASAINNRGTLTVNNSALTNNIASNGTGAIYNFSTAVINDSVISGNEASHSGGGGLNDVSANMTMSRVALFGNTCYNYGGGAFTNRGTLKITDSTIETNIAQNTNPNMGAGGIENSGKLTILNSTFMHNRTDHDGGAIHNIQDANRIGVVTVTNSTFADNSAGDQGGAFYVGAGDITLLNSTLTGNYATTGGGGFYIAFNGTLKIGNTISVDNFAPIGTEIFNDNGTLTSNGRNLFGSAGDKGIVGTPLTTNATDLVADNVADILGELVDNGGVTRTYSLAINSPAIDAGDTRLVTGIKTDQRGTGCNRVANTVVDIGAFEFGGCDALMPLTVKVTGTGTGNVISDPNGIYCPDDCSADYANATNVRLAAVPNPNDGSVFAGWSGACSDKTGDCLIDMDKAQTVTATFNLIKQYNLSVAVTGSGTITSNEPGINCHGSKTCIASYSANQKITLTAKADTGGKFTGWGGKCTGTKLTCTVTIDKAKRVTAAFNWILTATSDGPGSITSDPVGIKNCTNKTCTTSYANKTTVQLTATPSDGAAFVSWNGCDSTDDTVCIVTMNKARTVTARFQD